MVLLASSLSLISVTCGGSDDELPFGLKSEVVTTAERVSDMVFAPDGRLFYAEQFTGNIRVVTAEGQLLDEPFAQLEVASYLGLDWGLTGLALDPDFATNHYLYAFYTKPAGTATPAAAGPAGTATPAVARTAPAVVPIPILATATSAAPPATTPATSAAETPSSASASAPPAAAPVGRPTLVRFTERNNKGENNTVITEDFPVTPPEHAGINGNGNIHFGPDGMLYVSIGDYDLPAKASSAALDLGSPIGKLLRIDRNGQPPANNPFAQSAQADHRVFAYGFREPFDFAFHPNTDALYGTDNTPDTCEELNIIKPGGNYGWPDVGEFPYATCGVGNQTPAIFYFAKPNMLQGDFLSLVEISGVEFVSAAVYPAVGDGLLVCETGTGLLRRAVLSGPEGNTVTANDILVKDCKRDITVSPAGVIYYSNDTEIRRLAAPTTPSG